MSSSYNRSTELRNVHAKDMYNLALILDDENYWQTLMEVIPDEINNHMFGTAEDYQRISLGATYKRKYSNDHIRLIENAIRRPGESRLYTQILFDEWGSSGRKQERPTLGVLLHLLVQSKLYRAADFVAGLLNEPKPPRPSNGPAAEFEIDIFNDIEEAVNDTRFYPNTEDLQENVKNDINKDYYTKYHRNADKKIPTINDVGEEPIMNTAPKPPPRLLKSARLLKQQKQILEQQQQTQLMQQTTNMNNLNSNNVEEYPKEDLKLNTQSNNDKTSTLSLASFNNMPKLSALINTTNISMVSENLLPNTPTLSIFDRISPSYEEKDEDDSLNSTPSLIYTKSNIAENHEEQNLDLNSIPIVVLSKSVITKYKIEESDNHGETNDLPAISELNVNGQQNYDIENIPSVALNFIPAQGGELDECAVNADDLNIPFSVANMNYNQNVSRHPLEAIEDCNGIEHDRINDVEVELEEDEDSIPNLSFLENRSSNNESSLTNVTNTSGENSFEQSVNDCSSTSTDNVPILSVFNQ